MADGDCEAETDAMAAISEDDDNPPAAASPVVECDVDIDEDIHLGWTNLVGYHGPHPFRAPMFLTPTPDHLQNNNKNNN